MPSRISRRLIVATLVFYFCVQLLVPFRHFLYPGNVSWTEEGHNFAWHMKLRSKDGLFRFYVDTPSERRAIDQSKYLTSRQQEEIASEPRLLRKFGRFLRSEYSRIGITECEVRVEAICSLNGRPYQFLVDPNVDISAVNGNPFHHASWIVPLTDSVSIGDYPTSFEERIERMRQVRSSLAR